MPGPLPAHRAPLGGFGELHVQRRQRVAEVAATQLDRRRPEPAHQGVGRLAGERADAQIRQLGAAAPEGAFRPAVRDDRRGRRRDALRVPTLRLSPPRPEAGEQLVLRPGAPGEDQERVGVEALGEQVVDGRDVLARVLSVGAVSRSSP